MNVQVLGPEHAESAVALWLEAGLTRPWNSPRDDFNRAVSAGSCDVLGIVDDGDVIGTAMVGHDGHRGWVYYLAVAQSQRTKGHGAALMHAAEEWVRQAGMPKIQLMVRWGNVQAEAFYLHRGYEKSDVAVYGQWLTS